MILPIDFAYPVFAAILLLTGISMGLFASPNRAAVMNSLPAGDRGAGGGMNQTFQNSAQVISIGIFFTLLVIGLSSTLPSTLSSGLQAHGVSAAAAHDAADAPPISVLFAAFLGYNPIQHLVGPTPSPHCRRTQHAVLTGHTFFPHLISGPFSDGLDRRLRLRDRRLPRSPQSRPCSAAAATTTPSEPASRRLPHHPKLEEQHAR